MRFKEYLENNNISVKTFSDASGIPIYTLYKYYNSEVEPNLSNALKIHKASLGAVSLESLLLEREEKNV